MRCKKRRREGDVKEIEEKEFKKKPLAADWCDNKLSKKRDNIARIVNKEDRERMKEARISRKRVHRTESGSGFDNKTRRDDEIKFCGTHNTTSQEAVKWKPLPFTKWFVLVRLTVCFEVMSKPCKSGSSELSKQTSTATVVDCQSGDAKMAKTPRVRRGSVFRAYFNKKSTCKRLPISRGWPWLLHPADLHPKSAVTRET